MGRMRLFFDLACACQVVHTTFGPKTASPLYFKSTHYKILNCSEITPKTGAGDGAVRQARAA